MSEPAPLADILDEFRGLLAASYPFLLRAGLGPGDDEWDEFNELAFELVVGAPIERAWQQPLGWRYATWDGSAQIVVTATQRIVVGKALTSPDGSIRIEYEDHIPRQPTRFAFREFQHPLMNDPVAAVEFVLGEVVAAARDRGADLAIGTHVCAPRAACRFELT